MKYPCELIRDLLPLAADGVCSDASKKAVEEHLMACESCRALAALGEKEMALRKETDRQTSVGKTMFRRVKGVYFVLGLIGYLMLVGWGAFLVIALMNPQMSAFSSLGVTYLLYSVYIVCMSILIVMSCLLRPKNIRASGRIKPHAWCLASAWACFALWWIAFFIHNLFGWDSSSLLLRRFDAVATTFFFAWLMLLLVGGALYLFDLRRMRREGWA